MTLKQRNAHIKKLLVDYGFKVKSVRHERTGLSTLEWVYISASHINPEEARQAVEAAFIRYGLVSVYHPDIIPGEVSYRARVRWE